MLRIDVRDDETQAQKEKKKRIRSAYANRDFWETTTSTVNYFFYFAIASASIASIMNVLGGENENSQISPSLGVSVSAIFMLLALSRMACDYQEEVARQNIDAVSLYETNRVEQVITFAPRLFELSVDLLFSGISTLGVENASSILFMGTALSLSASIWMKLTEKGGTVVHYAASDNQFSSHSPYTGHGYRL